MDFVIGGLAGVGAGFFSNPFDVVKTRMQLQGELKARGRYAVHYKNIPHAVYQMVKHDGLMSLQLGLVPALWFQWVVNGTRLGIYQMSDNYGLLRNEKGQTTFLAGIFFGAIAGAAGGFFGSPLQLVKTQLMSASSKNIAVGTQHAHPGMMSAFKRICATSGLMGLWRGAHGMMIRNGIGSSSQMSVYSTSKEYMEANQMFQSPKYLASCVASNLGAVSKCIFLTPMDVIMTRLYNQEVDSKGRGALYHGVCDCARKITTAEGLLAFYKGIGPSFFRQGPHTVLLLVFWDILKDQFKSFEMR